MTQTNRKFNLSFVSEMTGGNRIATLVLLAGIGLLMLLWPEATLQVAIKISGAVLVFLGGWYVYSWYRGGRLGDKQPVVFGVFLALVGLFLFLKAGFVVSMVNIVIGILLIIYGVVTLNGALASRGISRQWLVSALIAAATLFFGIICLFSHAATRTIVRGAGIVMIVNALSQFFATRK